MDEDIWLEFKDLKITEKQIPILLDRFNYGPLEWFWRKLTYLFT